MMQAFEKHAILFLLQHLAYGTIGAVVICFGLLYYDMYGLWTLMVESPDGWLIGFMLFFGFFITFGSVGMGLGIMSLGQERDE